MEYVAFAVGIGGFERGRPSIHELLVQWNARLAAEATGLHLRHGYGKTGNFFLTAEPDRGTREISRLLCDTLKTKFAVFPAREFFRWIGQLRVSVHSPKPPAGRCATLGVAMDVNPDGDEPPTPPKTRRMESSSVAVRRIRGVWKLDILKPGGKRKDPNRREGGWGAVSQAMKKLRDGDWTSRSLTTLDGMEQRLGADHAPAGQIASSPESDLITHAATEALMISDRAIAHVLRPLSDPLPPALEQRGRKIREALEGLDAKDRLELACRTVLGVLMTARPRFRGERELVFNTLCAGVLQWLKREMKPLRFIGPN